MSTVSYTSLEPRITSELGIGNQSLSFNSSQPVSFFASTSFIYLLLFTAIVTAAFYRYALAGIWRMQSSSTSISKSNEIFKTVTWGLLGVFSLFLILYTFNKDLVVGDVGLSALHLGRISNNSKPSTQTTPSTSRTNPPIPANNDDPRGWEAIRNDAAVRTQLKNLRNGGILVNKSVCINPVQTSCTTVGGLPGNTISMLSQLRNTCRGGNIRITGGSEAGHTSHGPGLTPVDLSLNDSQLESCIRGFPVAPQINFCNKTYTNFGYLFCDETNTDRHWHVYQ